MTERGPSPVPPLRQRPMDLVLVAWLCLFAFTSLVMEAYVVFGVDLADCTDPLGRLWYLYASRWDPIFLATPLWLRIMCGIDMFVFGPIYLWLAWGLSRGDPRIRVPGFLFVGAIVYSTSVYFAVEFVQEAARADLVMVVVVNVPYTLVPLWLALRLGRKPLFPGDAVTAYMTGGSGARE